MPDLIAVRRASPADAAVIARHRVEMFRDMGALDEPSAEPLREATMRALARMMPAGEYVAWLAFPVDRPEEIVGGAGAQVRALLPRPLPDRGTVRTGPEAIILNVYTAPAWRRQGVARVLMEQVIAWAREEKIARLVLHASPEGRRLYEQLGFEATNEMRYRGEL
jgi:GNAT superfamily N-acetyltransferase